jgi:hypothetical protein
MQVELLHRGPATSMNSSVRYSETPGLALLTLNANLVTLTPAMSVKPTITSSGRATTGRREGDRALTLVVGRRVRKHGREHSEGEDEPQRATTAADDDDRPRPRRSCTSTLTARGEGAAATPAHQATAPPGHWPPPARAGKKQRSLEEVRPQRRL